MPSSPLILTLDVGTSSVRTMLFYADGKEVAGIGSQVKYEPRTTADGGFEMDADAMVEHTCQSVDEACAHMRSQGLKPDAVAVDTFWHSVTGIGEGGVPATPILHLFDTRAAGAASKLADRIDNRAQHSRTGCVLHASYYPAKLLWLSEAQPEVFARVKRWMSFGEYFFLKLFGNAVASTSMISGTGLWDQNKCDYDAEILGALPVQREQLASLETMDRECKGLIGEFKGRWPELDGIPWYPAVGDGASNNVGSGCVSADRFGLMVGTSGAMRAVIEAPQVEIRPGLWCYRVDRRRFVLGGALSNGGSVYAWLKSHLQVGKNEDLEREIAGLEPGTHGLTVLPLFAGERSPHWRADARAAFIGLSAHTPVVDIARAALESVAMTFREIFDLMVGGLGRPKQIVASGGALLHSPVWTRMMADALGSQVSACVENEATSRGVALLGLERLGAIQGLDALPPNMGDCFEPTTANRAAYDRMHERQKRLYAKLFEEIW